MREEYVHLFGEKKFKFQWIETLNNYNNREFIFLSESSIQNIKKFINNFGINLTEYINFLKN